MEEDREHWTDILRQCPTSLRVSLGLPQKPQLNPPQDPSYAVAEFIDRMCIVMGNMAANPQHYAAAFLNLFLHPEDANGFPKGAVQSVSSYYVRMFAPSFRAFLDGQGTVMVSVAMHLVWHTCGVRGASCGTLVFTLMCSEGALRIAMPVHAAFESSAATLPVA